MKKLLKKIWVIPLVLLGLLLMENCKKETESSYVCDTTTISGETIQACCNDTDCYYEWNGKKYYCDKQDCTAAAQELVNDIMGGGKSLPIDNDIRLENINKLLNLNR